MLQTILSRLGWLVLLVAMQVLVFNHIHIAGYATPLVYVYFLLILPSSTPHWLYVVAGFVVGLVIDLFTNTPGMAAASLCACGFVTPWLLNAFAPKERDDEEFLPSATTMKWGSFLLFALSITVLHCALFFLIEAFTVSEWATLLITIGCSAALTFLLVVGLELLRTRSAQ